MVVASSPGMNGKSGHDGGGAPGTQGEVAAVGRAGRWLVAGLIALAALGVATWVSGAFALTRLLPSPDIRWPVAFVIGAAAAGFAGLWGQSWAAQTGDQAAGGAAASNVG